MDNSYLAMRDLERIEVSILSLSASFSEWIDAEEGPLRSDVVLIGVIASIRRMREYDDAVQLPELQVRVVVEEKHEASLGNLDGKFPLGMLKICRDEIYIRVFFRPSLFSTLCQNLSAVTDGEISLAVSLPFHEEFEADTYYPILSYGLHLSRGKGVAPNNSLKRDVHPGFA